MRARRARAETEPPGRIVVDRSQRQHTPLTTGRHRRVPGSKTHAGQGINKNIATADRYRQVAEVPTARRNNAPD
jgi:hypothetical protein